jgi:hypothetical protein
MSQILTGVEGVEVTAAALHVTASSNGSESGMFELQAYFACPLRIMCTISIPLRITWAMVVDSNPSIGCTRRLMAR